MKHFLSCRKTSYSKLLKIVVLWVYLDLNQGLTRYQRVTLPSELYTHHQKTIDSFTYANIQEIAVCLLSILKMQMYNDCSCGRTIRTSSLGYGPSKLPLLHHRKCLMLDSNQRHTSLEFALLPLK